MGLAAFNRMRRQKAEQEAKEIAEENSVDKAPTKVQIYIDSLPDFGKTTKPEVVKSEKPKKANTTKRSK